MCVCVCLCVCQRGKINRVYPSETLISPLRNAHHRDPEPGLREVPGPGTCMLLLPRVLLWQLLVRERTVALS